MLRKIACCLLCLLPPSAPAQEAGDRPVPAPAVTVPLRDGDLPRTRWDDRPEAALWTRSALAALRSHAASLGRTVPGDIADWCPAYPQAEPRARRAFWVGFLSALARHESTHDPRAVGGGGRWFGLLQIQPSTARGYNCRATSGEALRRGADNLSCALRIMAHTVARDGVVARGMGGVAADWGPLRSRAKRRDMAAWLRRQSYCRRLDTVRPRARPALLVEAEAPDRP